MNHRSDQPDLHLLRQRGAQGLLGAAPTPPVTPSGEHLLRLDVAGVATPCESGDALSTPRSLLLRLDAPPKPAILGAETMRTTFEVLAIDTPAAIDRHPQADRAWTLDASRAVALPGLVNAHTHLDLTHVGPTPWDHAQPFAEWLKGVVAARPAEPNAIQDAVRAGVEASLAGGVVAVGDIAGCPHTGLSTASSLALALAPMLGISFVEFFAIGGRASESVTNFSRFVEGLASGWPRQTGIRLGISPHAPYTVSPKAYRCAGEVARRLALPCATHLAESADERAFVQHARGAQRELLEKMGLFDEAVLRDFGHGAHPIEHTLDAWAGSPLLAVHLNDLGDTPAQRDTMTQRLLDARATVVYCPRASEFFGAASSFGPHPYRELLNAGVPVCLGTDSIINLPPEQAASGISTWHDARLLVERDGLGPSAALDLITSAGARALGLDPERFELATGRRPAGLGLVAAPEPDHRSGVFADALPPMLLLNGC